MSFALGALRRANSLLFVLLLVSGGVLFFAVERSAISEGEKRKLAQMPSFGWRALTSHDYFRAIDDFVADNFAFRYVLTELSGEIRAARAQARRAASGRGSPVRQADRRPAANRGARAGPASDRTGRGRGAGARQACDLATGGRCAGA